MVWLMTILLHLLWLFTMGVQSHPLHLSSRAIGQNIRHLPCKGINTLSKGTCMFALDCMKANGTHLGTCIDRFLFGSCCDVSNNYNHHHHFGGSDKFTSSKPIHNHISGFPLGVKTSTSTTSRPTSTTSSSSTSTRPSGVTDSFVISSSVLDFDTDRWGTSPLSSTTESTATSESTSELSVEPPSSSSSSSSSSVSGPSWISWTHAQDDPWTTSQDIASNNVIDDASSTSSSTGTGTAEETATFTTSVSTSPGTGPVSSTSTVSLKPTVSFTSQVITLISSDRPTTTTTPSASTTTTTTVTSDGTSSPTSSGDDDGLIDTTTEIFDVGQLEELDYKTVCGRQLIKGKPTGRIVNGQKTQFGEWPWQISLRQWKRTTFMHKCGAALLNENWAITAAHCVDGVPPEDLLLRIGEFDLSSDSESLRHVERRVQIMTTHPDFNSRTFENDLALLRFYDPVKFQQNILPICLPTDDDNYVNKTGYVTGWGRLYVDGPLPNILQEVQVPVITNAECEQEYRKAGFLESIPDIFLCAGYDDGGRDSCEGDSGGPLVIKRSDDRWLLAGIISWGIGCAEPHQPGVYTRITKFKEWINQILVF